MSNPVPGPAISPRMTALAAAGLDLLGDPARRSLDRFLDSVRTPDGGYRGRGAGADLYYSSFGLALARLLGRPPTPLERAFVQRFDAGDKLDLVHWTALARAYPLVSNSWTPAAVWFQALETRRAEARTKGPYALFLVALAAESLGAPPVTADTIEAVEAFRAADGGYRAASSGPSVTSVTAAAVTVLFPPPEPALEFLASMRHPSGGWLAARAAPAPDLLSTAVALAALRLAGRPPPSDPDAGIGFIEHHWRESGGCAGHPDDPTPDVEYTWYALLALGALV